MRTLSTRSLLYLILALAIVVRIPAALYLGPVVEPRPGTHDQVSYDALAKSLLAGEGYTFPENWYPFTPAETPTAHWSFLYPAFLAGTYTLVGYQPLLARLIQAVVTGLATCLLVYAIGRRVANEQVGLVAAALAALYGYFVYYNAALMTESFFIVLLLLAVLLALELKERPTMTRWLMLGVTLGLATLLRQTMLLLIPVFLGWLWWERRKDLTLWHLFIPPVVVVLFILPWTIRNALVYEEFLPLNSNASYVLYAANHPHLGADWETENIVVPIPEELEGLNEAQLNNELTGRAIEFILADPGRYLLLTLNKSLEYFKFWPSSESSLISNVNRVGSYGLLLPFMIGGFLLSLARWRVYLLLYLVFIFHTVIHLLSWPAVRYRLPVDALFMPLAALALLELVARARAWRADRPVTDDQELYQSSASE